MLFCLLVFLLPLVVVAPPPPPPPAGDGCWPPPMPYPNQCPGGFQLNTVYSCAGAEFNLTSGLWFPCETHEDCYNRREPNEWCYAPPGFQWTDKGCFCDQKLGSCIIERQSYDRFEWAYCMRQSEFNCAVPTGYCY